MPLALPPADHSIAYLAAALAAALAALAVSSDTETATHYLEIARAKWQSAYGRDKRTAYGEMRSAEDELERANARAADQILAVR